MRLFTFSNFGFDGGHLTMHIHLIRRRASSRARTFAAVFATAALAASAFVGAASASVGASGAAGCSSPVSGPSRVGSIGGLVHPLATGAGCVSGAVPGFESPYIGTPPLLYHGGPMMSTQATNDEVVVTPIYWEPTGSTFTAGYKSTITQYLTDLAHDSGKLSNVFSSLYQYSGSNGGINYKMQLGTPISDTDALPADGCVVASSDTTNVYADNSGYSNCLDDAQIHAETDAVVSGHSLPSDLGHLYVVFLPKHVESCINPGSTTTAANACTLNHQPSAAYCAYHSQSPSGTVYANMPFPAYQSGTGFSCTKESLGGGIQSPNGNTDADVEISPLSHEMAEAITDPDASTGWYDSSGNENGDDCAYLYGALSGTAGSHYNQVVNGHHYLTQEEFSNKDFVANTNGCIQRAAAVKPKVTLVSPNHGPASGGNHVTLTGTGFPGASSVHFGAKSASFTVLDASHIDAKVPSGLAVVDVTVSTSAGTSTKVAADHYTYPTPRPTVGKLSPTKGTHAGGTKVTITGTGFIPGATVHFGKKAGNKVTVVSTTKITVRTPKHAKGKVDVTVTTSGGTSAKHKSDHYTFT
jgi:hypothetical protein